MWMQNNLSIVGKIPIIETYGASLLFITNMLSVPYHPNENIKEAHPQCENEPNLAQGLGLELWVLLSKLIKVFNNLYI